MNSFPNPNYLDPLSNAPLAQGGRYRVIGNYLGGVGNSQNTNNMSIKVDEQWSQKSKYFFEWLFNPTSYGLYQEPWTGPTFPQDQVGFNGAYPFNNANQIFSIGNTYSLGSTLINEFRASFTRQFITTHPDHPLPNSITDQSAVLALMAAREIPEGNLYPTPYFGVGNYEWGPTSWSNAVNMAEAYTFSDNITKVMGRHTITAGLMYRLEHTTIEDGFPTILSFGGLDINPLSGLGGGEGLSQFLQGAVGDGSFTGRALTSYQRARAWGFHGQDEFHVTPSFTLNLGLRYDIFGYYKTRYPVDANFCFSCGNSATGLPGSIVYTHGQQDVAPPLWKDVAPRVNFAWTPFRDKKTVIRGGYDIFYSNAAQIQMAPGQAGGTDEPGWEEESNWVESWTPQQCTSFTGACVAFPLSDTTTNKASLLFPALTSTYPAQQEGQDLGLGMNVVGRPGAGGGDKDPMIQMWSLEVQRELPGNVVISVGYTGTHGTHLYGDLFRPANFVPTADLLKYKTGINSSVPITNFYSGLAASGLASLYGSSSLPLNMLLKPYPFYGLVNLTDPLDGVSQYNAFELKIQKRLSHDLSFAVAYTNSKQIDNCCDAEMSSMVFDSLTSGGEAEAAGNVAGRRYQDPDNRNADRALDTGDIPQILSFNATYFLPFGAGKRFLNQKGVLNQVVGGWRLAGNFVAESGLPLHISCPRDTLQSAIVANVNGADTARCDLVGNPHIAKGSSKAQREADWINPNAFEPSFGSDQNVWKHYDPTASYAWQFGDMGPVLPNMRSPGFWTLDNALTKNFQVSESKHFEFRWEAFNSLNHMNLGFPITDYCLSPTASGGTDLVHKSGCSFGRITDIQTDPRAMEFSLKFYW